VRFGFDHLERRGPRVQRLRRRRSVLQNDQRRRTAATAAGRQHEQIVEFIAFNIGRGRPASRRDDLRNGVVVPDDGDGAAAAERIQHGAARRTAGAQTPPHQFVGKNREVSARIGLRGDDPHIARAAESFSDLARLAAEARPEMILVGVRADEAALPCAVVREMLRSGEAPIVLLRSRGGRRAGPIAPSVAPGNPNLGALLPYTPLHHLLMREVGRPVVATSGNRSDEPICIDAFEAVKRLGGIADRFLVHDRPIVRRADDSVVRCMVGRETVLRRARGYAPVFLSFPAAFPSMLAVGGHLKNTVALTSGNQVFISPHIGDLDTPEALAAFQGIISGLRRLYAAEPERILCDLHPDYGSTRFALNQGRPVIPVQHHHAHVASCMAEHGLDGPVLGVAWDGTGFGSDGTIWGGEFLRTDADGYRREASFRKFRLPGGAAAVREPRRSAAGLMFAVLGEGFFEGWPAGCQFFKPSDRNALRVMLVRGVQSPWTSSAGRLFDAVAAMVGLRARCHFEGQAAMELEYAIGGLRTDEAYPFGIGSGDASAPGSPRLEVDWEPVVLSLLEDLRQDVPTARIAARFHNALAEIIVEIAKRSGEDRVVLTGGCFQNRYLTERAVRRLRMEGLHPYWHQRVPPNDGGIALGQAWIAARSFEKSRSGPAVETGPTTAAR